MALSKQRCKALAEAIECLTRLRNCRLDQIVALNSSTALFALKKKANKNLQNTKKLQKKEKSLQQK